MFNKIFASVGIGSAKVDTRLRNNSLFAGQVLEGEIHLQGGKIEQKIEEIYLEVITTYKKEINDSTVTQEYSLIKHHLGDSFNLQANEQKKVTFAFPIPYETPLTMGGQPVFLRTGLGISLAIDPKDKDHLEIKPHPLIQLIFNALDRLGFKLKSAKCEYSRYSHQKCPFIQELEFYPFGKYKSHLDELEVVFNLSANSLNVLLEIDRKAKGLKSLFAEALDMDESHVRFQVTPQDLELPFDHFTQKLDHFISNYI